MISNSSSVRNVNVLQWKNKEGKWKKEEWDFDAFFILNDDNSKKK